MRTNHIIAVIFIASVILIGALIAYLMPRFINTQKPFINKAEIIKFASPDANAPDITEEYHLWLKMELSPNAFDNIFQATKDESPKDASINPSHQYIGVGVKKDEMRSERLVTQNVIQDMLVIKGYINEGAITNTGLPLRINKVITLTRENLRPLESDELRRDHDSEPLANPQGVSRRIFQPQTDIYQSQFRDGGEITLYIHLESGIKPRNTPNLLSLTITYLPAAKAGLNDNQATRTQTLALFSY